MVGNSLFLLHYSTHVELTTHSYTLQIINGFIKFLCIIHGVLNIGEKTLKCSTNTV